ncbi:MAG TPA: cupredoxin domain-containing protein [Mycobacteriales bacterium]|nr:cupredoxin domain-containing protein [Mycobacteriales bacterium]
MRAPVLPTLAVALCLAVTGCGSDDDNTAAAGDKQKVTVTAGDTTCALSEDHFKAGELELEVKNDGKDVTEVYVYAKGDSGKFDKVVGEVENIAPGTEREFEVEVGGGEYEVACKPGQKGDGIRTEIEVSGEAKDSEQAYDREIEVEATDYAFTGLEGFTAKAGEKIEFKLENKGKVSHNLEILDAAGKEIGEVDTVAPGEKGEAIIELEKAGTYTFICSIGTHEEQGMKGTFTVTS